MIRELTLSAVVHPQFLNDGTLMLVDHPTTRVLNDGEPTLGWEGDPRLAIYLHLQEQQFYAFRLEHDGEYRPFAVLPAGAEITPESMNAMIAKLIEGDQRRGSDPVAKIITAQDKIREDAAAQSTAFIREELAPKLLYGLSRSHLPGVDVHQVRNVLPRR